MDINSWSASVSSDWIKVLPSGGTLPMTDPIKITVQSADTLTYDVDGVITFNVGGKIFLKHVKRCVPRIKNVRYELSFEAGEIDLCGENIESAITNISGFTIYELDNGTEDTKPNKITYNDISFSYEISGITYGILPKNDEEINDGKNITVIGTWNNASYSASTTQKGMSDDDISNKGSAGSGIIYNGFDFAPEAKNKKVEGCTQGTFEYAFTGKRIASQGILTGITPCGNAVTLESSQGNSSDIPSENIVLSCNDSSININGLTVEYPTNTTYSDKRYVITATIVDTEARVIPRPISTNLYVPAGSCASGYKVWIFADKQYLSETNSDIVTLTYFATDSDIVPSKVSDIPINQRIYENVILDLPENEDLLQYFILGSKTVKNGTNQQKVEFKKFTTESDIQFIFNAHLNDIASQNSAVITKPSDISGAIYRYIYTNEIMCVESDMQTRWVDSGEVKCEEKDNLYRWINEGEPTCEDGDDLRRWINSGETKCENS